MNKAVELLPCPFCGGEAKKIEDWRDSFEPIEITKIGCSCGVMIDICGSYIDAVKAWNTRATPSLEAIIEKIVAEKLAYHLEADRYDIGARAFADKAISIIREFQINQTKGN